MVFGKWNNEVNGAVILASSAQLNSEKPVASLVVILENKACDNVKCMHEDKIND